MSRVERWEHRAETPLIAVSLVFLVAYGGPIAWPSLPAGVDRLCGWVVTATWVVLGLDYATRLVLADDRPRFVRAHLLDLALLLLPVLRPLRLLRLAALLSVLHRVGARSLRGRVVLYVGAGTVLLVLTGALAVTDAERGAPDATITHLGDGLWWALTTMTTVGYGDRYPVTTTGRFVAAALMIGGVALVGVVTATIASWLVDRVAAENEQEQVATRTQVTELAEEVRALRAELSQRAARADGDVPAPREPVGRAPGD
ncbi:potassium channel family protein [Cellulomonas shaoxiangyii]|uniref:Two pore domain potassium channel family protein n=1 Tax=Cellulomonas shaoxiangyii TaxID=2566013 RepID=A0A4P7SKX7_9CELL|nr:potassium channel family protein [Cellulomonas shaoxiangyii]QCB94959.1 two pore domain potassium channel family protein [Cellulomonas shaoxiangyii]TGY82043.1 two pore domain potassium channel family protein [Cellulomonas shaoxiangyii]